MNNFVATAKELLLNLGLVQLRTNSQIVRTIRSDISSEVVDTFDSIKIKLPIDRINVADFTGSLVNSALKTNSIDVVVDQYKHTAFELTDKEIVEFETNGVIAEGVAESLSALGQNICNKVISGYKDVYNFVGTDSNNDYKTSLVFEAEKVLRSLGVSKPQSGYFWAAFSSQACLDLVKDILTVDKAGSRFDALLQAGIDALGVVSNVAIINDTLLDNVYHTAGTAAADTITVSTNTASGATSIVLAGTNGSTLKVGDLFTITGVKQQFVVLEDETFASGVATVSFAPALKSAVTSTTAVNVLGSHDVNIVYHPNWQVFVMRGLHTAGSSIGESALGFIAGAVDPQTGMTFKFEASREAHNKYQWSFMTLYGTKVIRPDHCVRVLRPA